MATTHTTTIVTTDGHPVHAAGMTTAEREAMIRTREATFASFMKWMLWSAVLTLLVLVFLALTNA